MIKFNYAPSLIFALIVAIALVISIITCCSSGDVVQIPSETSKSLTSEATATPLVPALCLSNYPELFKNYAEIVISGSATDTEYTSAYCIAAELRNATGNAPDVITDADVKESSAILGYDSLILVGINDSNELLNQIQNMGVSPTVTETYPGHNKGMISVIESPWNEERSILIISASDTRGLVSCISVFEDIRGIQRESVAIEWSDTGGKFSHQIGPDEYVYVDISLTVTGLHARVDRPATFKFNEKSGVLETGNSYLDVNSNLVVVTGYRHRLRAPGGGAGGGLFGSYSLPYSMWCFGGSRWEITYVESDGTIHALLGDKSLYLEPGTSQTYEFVKQTEEEDVVFTFYIRNEGLQQKSKIILSVED